MFKKFTKRRSAFFISVSFVSLCIIGIIIQQSVFSSRVVLKDELQIHRKLLHNAEGEHACHCFSPFITGFRISNITSSTADINWRCDVPSTYQVKWGENTSKQNYFPTQKPTVSYADYTVKLTGLKPGTEYHVGPSSICLRNCTANESNLIGTDKLRRNADVDGRSDWTFTTLGSQTFSVSGAILTSTNEGISGVTVELTGDENATGTTDNDGIYTFPGLAPGTYTITPTKENYEFEPPFVTYDPLSANQTDINFEGIPTTGILEEQLLAEARVEKVTAKEVTIRWKTKFPATSLVEYGLTTEYGLKTEMNMIQATDHVIQVFDFQLGTTYHARAVSTDPTTGKAVYSADLTFKTPVSEIRIIDPKTVFNEPNPAFIRTTFVYHLYQPVQRMTIDILTLSGKTVATLEAPQSTLKEGYNKVMWDLRDNSNKRVVNGVYLYKMKFYLADNQFKEVKKSNLIVRK